MSSELDPENLRLHARRLIAEAGGVIPPIGRGPDPDDLRATNGLQQDGWWHRVRPAERARARGWVRWTLLRDPHMTDAAADRFIASLSVAKREDLLRRAAAGAGAWGF